MSEGIDDGDDNDEGLDAEMENGIMKMTIGHEADEILATLRRA